MLYTRKGDNGTTKVIDSKERFSKGSELAEALGALDELNSFIGLSKVKARQVQDGGIAIGGKTMLTSDILGEVQQNLFIIQAETAGARKTVTKTKISQAEKIINAIEKEIPKLIGFSVAGGTELSALLDVARTLARRAERRVIVVKDSGIRKFSPNTLAYINRLSSLLFALARLSNYRSGIKEESPKYK